MFISRVCILSMLTTMLLACGQTPEPDGRGEQVGYRSGTADDGYLSNGERGNVQITEIHWAGSVKGEGGDAVYDPDDVFIELLNKSGNVFPAFSDNQPIYQRIAQCLVIVWIKFQ